MNTIKDEMNKQYGHSSMHYEEFAAVCLSGGTVPSEKERTDFFFF